MSRRGPRFSEKEKLTIVQQGEKIGVKGVCARYGISTQRYRVWRYKVRGIQPRKRFSLQEKLRILEDGYQNGILKVCTAHRIDPATYYNWRRKFRYPKSPRGPGRPPRFSEEEKLAIVKEAEKTSVKAVCAKYGISTESYRLWRYKIRGIQPRKYSVWKRSFGF